MYLCQMISKQRATSVGFDDLVDAFRFDCRALALNSCRKIQISLIQRILRSIFSSLHYTSPRYFTPCSFPPHQTKRFPSPNFSLCYLFFPPFFTAKKSPLLSFSSFIFCVLCHFYRSTLCVCVLKYILNLRYAQFHHLPTQDF